MNENVKMKKPIYKQWYFILIAILLIWLVSFVVGFIVGFFGDGEQGETEQVDASIQVEKKAEEKTLTETSKNETSEVKEEKMEIDKSQIDTNVFEYATVVDLTDAIDTNQHVTAKIQIIGDVNPGMAVQDVISQTFDFIQQDDMKGAKTITILVSQNDKKISQYTVQKDKYTPNDDDPMADLVLKASEIEFMSPEVKAYGEAMGSW
jgi:hypothetical protein